MFEIQPHIHNCFWKQKKNCVLTVCFQITRAKTPFGCGPALLTTVLTSREDLLEDSREVGVLANKKYFVIWECIQT